MMRNVNSKKFSALTGFGKKLGALMKRSPYHSVGSVAISCNHQARVRMALAFLRPE